RLIVEREREIRAFIPEEYWEAFANLSTQSGEVIRSQVTRYQGKEFRPTSEAETTALMTELEKLPFSVRKREDKPTSSRPAAPFITSTLQQAASTRLGFSVKKTMTLAQRLYEAGYITYMRTDSTNLSQDAVESVRHYIGDKLGADYLPENPRQYSSKEGAQEAHEAIRPSDVKLRANDLNNAEPDAQRLYDLIWRRFVACQTADAKFTSTSITTSAGDFELRTRGRVIRFDGHLRVLSSAGKDEDVLLPDVAEGDKLLLSELQPKQHFTKPSPRFSEAALVKELEKQGIGRPSTYASIISTIQDRGYVSLKGRRFYAEKMGDIVTSRLVENFDDLMDYSFTATMEEKLDDIADGEVNWTQVLDEFYNNFHQKLDQAESEEGGMRPNSPVDTDIDCPACGRHMQIRTGSTGVFLGCS
ncbi:MAG: type I DNA topoisomerase, partial [Oceanobacter sp.]